LILLLLTIVILLHLLLLLLDRLHLHVIVLLHRLLLLIHLIYLWINIILIHRLLSFSNKITLVKYDLIINHFVIFYKKIKKKILVNLEKLKDSNFACTIIRKECPTKS